MTEFKFPLAFSRKRKKIDRFDSLPQFHWEEITCQDVIGQGTYGAVFISRYRPQDKPAETVVVKKQAVLFPPFGKFPVFEIPRFSKFPVLEIPCFSKFPLLEIPRFSKFPLLEIPRFSKFPVLVNSPF